MPDHSPSTDERASLAQLSQSSSPLECTSHLGFSLVLPVHLLDLAPLLSSVGAVAGDELHTELKFWQSAMGYTDNATVQVTVAGEKRPSSQEER